jgi:23S rRNA (cytidine1920-2'-O)/16S rRNA (cytidine1409-2'-O)-methyltransferase
VSRVRLDRRLLDLGLAESRERAQALIMAGQVVVGDHAASKPGQLVDEAADVRLKGEALPYVSRGALKLLAALDHFGIDPAGRAALDVGASTGGFTDLLLQRGARAVCALDVGHNQLAWKLRSDERVRVIEGYNARHLRAEDLPFSPELVVCDASFISLTLLLPRLVEVGRAAGWIVCLVKPQFEVGKGEVGKGGVVRDPAQRQAAVDKVAAAARALGAEVVGVIESPITGPAGNVEYLMALRPGAAPGGGGGGA